MIDDSEKARFAEDAEAQAIIDELTRERDEARAKTEHVLACLRGQQQATKEAHVAIARQRNRADKAEKSAERLSEELRRMTDAYNRLLTS